MNTAPPVNYRLPILATIASTLVVITLFVLLAFFTAAWSLRQFTTTADDGTGSPLIGGLCGVATLAMIAGVVYFSLAVIKGVRDLTTPLQHLPGYIERKYTGMGRTGGFWIVVRTGDRPLPIASSARLTPPPPPAPPPVPAPSAASTGSTTSTGTAPGGFGGGLAEIARQVSTAPRPPAEASSPAPAPPAATDWTKSHIFRVDKAVYNALRDGEPVVIAYSRFLEHVYYVEHTEAGEPVPLRNTSLL